MTTLADFQEQVICNLDLESILIRDELGKKLSNHLGKDIIILYDETLFFSDEKHIEWLSCIVDNDLYCLMFNDHIDKHFEKGMINKKKWNTSFEMLPNLFCYIFYPKGSYDKRAPELINQYRKLYYFMLESAKRVDKISELR